MSRNCTFTLRQQCAKDNGKLMVTVRCSHIHICKYANINKKQLSNNIRETTNSQNIQWGFKYRKFMDISEGGAILKFETIN